MASKGVQAMSNLLALLLLVIIGSIGIALVGFAIWVTAAMENFDEFNWLDDD